MTPFQWAEEALKRLENRGDTAPLWVLETVIAAAMVEAASGTEVPQDKKEGR